MSRTLFIFEYSRKGGQTTWFLRPSTSSSNSDGHMTVVLCIDSYPCFVSILGTTNISFTQRFAHAWAWPQFYLCHLAERCRFVVACAPCLALVTLQECMPGRTDGILSSISKRPSAIITQRKGAIVGPLASWEYREIWSHILGSLIFPQTPLKSSSFQNPSFQYQTLHKVLE